MLHLSSITATFFVNLINRLGVRPPPPDGFDLINSVQPVSIVDSDITIPVGFSTPLLDIPASNGNILGPGASVVLADTGALATAGNYTFTILIGTDSAAAGFADIARRNAANSLDIWSQHVGTLALGYAQPLVLRSVINASERLVVRASPAGLGGNWQASIWTVQT